MIKSRNMRFAWHVAGIGKMKNTCKHLIRKKLYRRILVESTSRREENTEVVTIFTEIFHRCGLDPTDPGERSPKRICGGNES